jgi:hypothetical protein
MRFGIFYMARKTRGQQVTSVEYCRGGTTVTLLTSTIYSLLCNPLLKDSAASHFEQSAVSC